MLTDASKNNAVDAFRSAIANDPEETLSYKGLGFALSKAQRYEEAISTWQQFISKAPDDPDGPENLAAAMFDAKRYADAVPVLESAIRLNPDQASLYLQLGTVTCDPEMKTKLCWPIKKHWRETRFQ